MSGVNDAALQFRDPEVTAFLINLFHGIAGTARGDIRLTATDLTHAHMFLDVDTDVQVGTLVDFGLLFHAKEYPKEWRRSRSAPEYPVGAPEMISPRGDPDPRIGTLSSCKDPDFRLRNLVWLLSTNRIYQLDPDEPGCVVASTDEFRTVDSNVFDDAMPEDVNFFPAEAEVSGMILCCPHYAITSPTLRIKHILMGQTATKGDKCQAIEQLVLRLDDKEAKQLAQVAELPTDCVHRLSPLRARLDAATWIDISKFLVERARVVQEDMEEHNAQQFAKLVATVPGVTEEDARAALEATVSAQGLHSEMRAGFLLSLMHSRFRSQQLKAEFGVDEYPIDLAAGVLRQAVWVENALGALQRMRANPDLSQHEAVELAIQDSLARTEAAMGARARA